MNQQGGYFRDSSVLFWREGQGEWKQLGQLAELLQALQQAPPAGEQGQQQASGGAEAAPAAAAAEEEEAPRGRRGKGAKAKAVPTDPELAGFLSEISALEAEAEAEAEASPPLEERQFEDDDGTVYVWDSSLRKFMPQEVAAATASAAGAGAGAAGAGAAGAAGGTAPPAAVAAAAYNEEDMVFVPDEEQLPAYEPPPKVRGQREGQGEAGSDCSLAGWLLWLKQLLVPMAVPS